RKVVRPGNVVLIGPGRASVVGVGLGLGRGDGDGLGLDDGDGDSIAPAAFVLLKSESTAPDRQSNTATVTTSRTATTTRKPRCGGRRWDVGCIRSGAYARFVPLGAEATNDVTCSSVSSIASI